MSSVVAAVSKMLGIPPTSANDTFYFGDTVAGFAVIPEDPSPWGGAEMVADASIASQEGALPSPGPDVLWLGEPTITIVKLELGVEAIAGALAADATRRHVVRQKGRVSGRSETAPGSGGGSFTPGGGGGPSGDNG